jgi:transcriptional regulator with XRE-family HTH domain
MGCATIAGMSSQEKASFGDALLQALQAAGASQAALARELHVDASQVNRWVRGKAFPSVDTLLRINKFLSADLSVVFDKTKPKYELFVSAPISGIAGEEIPQHHDDIVKVVAAARQHVNGLSWPGERVRTAADRQAIAPDIATAHNMTEMHGCPAFLYLQFAELIGPSSALVELGFALGRKMKVTIIFKKGLTSPYMLRGFGGVAAKLPFLPDTRIYEEESADSAAALIASNGRELLGLT